MKVNQNAKKNLQNEIQSYTRNIKLQRAQIEDLVQENERHERETKGASRKYYVALEQLKLQEVQISEIHHKIIDDGSRLKQQKNLYRPGMEEYCPRHRATSTWAPGMIVPCTI